MKRKKFLWALPVLGGIIVLICFLIPQNNENQKIFLTKAELLKTEADIDEAAAMIGDEPVDSLGYVVFFSISDGSSRAKVYKGAGKTLEAAWTKAVKNTVKGNKG